MLAPEDKNLGLPMFLKSIAAAAALRDEIPEFETLLVG